MKATAQVFLAHAHEDKERVEDLYQELSDAGFKPWMDKKDILPGERWESCIQRAIQDSDFFLACLSANSVNKRGFFQREIREALRIWQEKLESDIYLIPARLEDCEVPEKLGGFQWVNLFEASGWTRLVKAIQVCIERRGEEFLPENEYGVIVSGGATQRQIEQKREQAKLFWQRGQDQWSKDNLTEAIVCFDRATKSFEETGEFDQAKQVLEHLAQVYIERGSRKKRDHRLAEAEENYCQVRSIYRRIGDASRESEILYKLGDLMTLRERSGDARSYLESSLKIWSNLPEEKKDLDLIARVRESLPELLPPMEAMHHLVEAVTIRAHQLNHPEAERLWQQANQLREQIGAIPLPKEIQEDWDKAEQALTNLREATSPGAV